MITVKKSRLRWYYWLVIVFLTSLHLTTAFFGFHPHHDGLMLATVRQLRDSFINNGEWPFNQYGLFWALPYLLIGLVIKGSYLLLAMRIFTLVLYIVSAFLTYRIANATFGDRVAKLSLALFILFRPLGLEPLPWPSSISMFLTISSLWFLLRSLNSQNIKVVRMFVFAGGLLTSANIFSRVQVGALILIAVSLFLFKFRRELTWYFISGFILFTVILFSFLEVRNWLVPALRDEFLFGWLVAGSGETDKSLPKVSLVFAVLVLSSFFLHRLNNRHLRIVKHSFIALITISAALLFVLNSHVFTSTYGKFVVGLVIAFLSYSLYILWISWKSANHVQLLLYIFSIAAGSQIYPLFDVMHAWWAITPLVILIATKLESISSYIPPTRFVKFGVFTCSLLVVLPYLVAVSTSTAEVSRRDLGSIRLSTQEQQSYRRVSNFLEKNIGNGALVLNLCPDARIFFTPHFVKSASRYFVYWKIMGTSEQMKREVLRSKPRYVLVCDPYGNAPDEVIAKFTSNTYALKASFDGVSIFAK